MSRVSLNESVELIERAVQKTGDSESALPLRLEVQAKALSDRFVLLGNLSDIDGAISALWRSLEALSLSDRDRWKHWKLLAHCLLVRYENTQEINDLQNAESAILSAVELDYHTSKSKSECLRISGKISFAKYNWDRNPTDLEKSINIYQQCIDLADREDQDVWICLNDLGNALLEKFETSKSNQDLQAAATSYQTALEKLRSSRTSSALDNEAILLTGLGNVQFRQFKEWDRTADLDTAISYYKKSVDATSEVNARISSRAATLSFALQSRFDITHRIEDLEDAQRRLEAVAELPLHLPSTSRSYIENRIGTVYLRFFFHSNNSKYLDSAAVHFRKALSSGCSERAFNMSAASNLAKTLGHKCSMTKSDTDITTAITQFASLLRLAKQTDPEMGSIAMNTAEFFSSIYDMKKATEMGKMALATYLMASQFGGISPKRKIYAKMKAAQLSFAVSDHAPMAFNALKSAVSDLPEAILAGLNRSDQLRMIRETVWLPSNVAAAAIVAGSSPEEAFSLFESSRGVIWESLLSEKYDVGSLESEHPDLAGKFKTLQKQVTRMTSADKLENPQLDVLKGRQESHQAALQYNEVLAQIRSLAGFESFLRVPQEPSSLTEFAAGGPVILVNCTEFRSDCLIIKQEGVVSIPLPGMTYDASIQNAANLMAALSETRNSPEWASKTFEEVLIWLWNNVAEPIMQELRYLAIPKTETQNRRVWWVSTGLISILPIHAAGDHRRALETGEPCSVIDLVTSSYCNSLRSLDYARKTFATSQLGQGKHNTLLLQMPETPNCDSLPGVAKEISLIKGILEISHGSVTVLNTLTREPVLSFLKTSQIAHFACHGVVDAEDPSLSRLLLQDWKQRPLNVRTLLRTNGIGCQLVFLSACESAVGKDIKLREEGIHISGGFQMAGVPHVVGTLWRVDDQFGVKVAENFYQDLVGNNVMNIERSSKSLRRAVLDARASGADPLYWAAYIHSGP